MFDFLCLSRHSEEQKELTEEVQKKDKENNEKFKTITQVGIISVETLNAIACRKVKTLWTLLHSESPKLYGLFCTKKGQNTIDRIALRKAKTLSSFGPSECNRVNTGTVLLKQTG